MKAAHLNQWNKKGFTLVELLITLAIIAILASIALPAYNDYVTRAQVSEGVELAGGLKAPVAAYGQELNAWPSAIVPVGTAPGKTEISGTLTGKYSSVNEKIDGTFPTGEIVAKIESGQAQGYIIRFKTENGGAHWTCNGGDIPNKWRPVACKM